jgi:hypothetical protein
MNKLTKNLLKNRTCDNCFHNKIYKYCSKQQTSCPKINTCESWKCFSDLTIKTSIKTHADFFKELINWKQKL